MNDLNENTLNPNCFEKTKEAWAIFSFFLPQMLKRRTSALLPITVCTAEPVQGIGSIFGSAELCDYNAGKALRNEYREIETIKN